MTAVTPSTLLTFWREADYDRWFKKDDAFDAELRTRFSELHARAANGGLSDWQGSDDGALALTILLDQFPRNLFRNDAKAFSTDAQARAVAIAAMDRGADLRVDHVLRPFFYLPLMHSEALADQQRSVALYEAYGDADQLKFAIDHRDIIARFGRFPHRNAVLGRTTTADERAFLDGGGFAG